MVERDGTYTTNVGSEAIDLPLVRIADDLAIALLITVDHGVGFTERAARQLADRLRDLNVDIVASVATMGIPLAIEVSRALGIDDYLIFQKTPKIHLADAISRARQVDHDRRDRSGSCSTGPGCRPPLDAGSPSSTTSSPPARPSRRRSGCSGGSVPNRLPSACCSPRQRRGGAPSGMTPISSGPSGRSRCSGASPDGSLVEDWEGNAGEVGAASRPLEYRGQTA